MTNINSYPASIKNKIIGKSYNTDGIGESGATVLVFDDMALKIEKTNESSENEYEILRWLNGKLPVPEIIEFARCDGFTYLLMTRLDGEMTCSDESLKRPEAVINALADGLKMLWSVDISDCPVKNGLDEKLRTARYNIDNRLVDMDNLCDTLKEGGFADVEALYDWLCDNRPDEDLIFSHGDYCLPNVFIANGRISGLLDLGSAGIADRWQDITLCVRSLWYYLNYLGKCRDEAFAEYRKRVFEQLGIQPDEAKIKYYTLLNELI